jgi:hypothetical protein
MGWVRARAFTVMNVIRNAAEPIASNTLGRGAAGCPAHPVEPKSVRSI